MYFLSNHLGCFEENELERWRSETSKETVLCGFFNQLEIIQRAGIWPGWGSDRGDGGMWSLRVDLESEIDLVKQYTISAMCVTSFILNFLSVKWGYNRSLLKSI